MTNKSFLSIRALLIALLTLVFFACLIWPLVDIQLRHWRNGAIAARLVESLQARFPAARFNGAASYDLEVNYISARSGVDPESRPDVEQWLRQLKADQRITPAIWLRFTDASDEKDWIKF